ncbi:MAG TPA: glycosyl hydrolase family 18 protein [Candidatus Dormibacteraeota bacterium]|nr:glycosyl hydrolase family 18 protein [Candidatus Dormibacteraeota bacterium]
MKHSVSATTTRLRRAATLATLSAVLCAAVLGLVRAAGQSAPAAPAMHDPRAGVHALQEREFGGATVRPASVHAVPAQTTAASSGSAQPAAAGGPSREMFGFAPYWDMANWKQWQLSRLSTIAYFGVTLDGSGNPLRDEGWTGWTGQQLTDLVSAAHAAGVRVLVTVKCFDTPTISSIVSNPTHAQNAVATAVSLARQRGLDGVDVDFEGATSATYPTIAQDLTRFLGALTGATHAAIGGSEVVVDTYSGSASWDGGLFNIGALAPNVDAFFVMAYDMNFDNTPNHASADAPLNGWTYNDTTLLQQYLTKAPASKVILGVPYYGYKWDVSAPIANAPDSGAAQASTYSGVFDDLACAQQLTRQWDATAATPWATWWSPPAGDPCGGNHNSWREMYYEDVVSIGAKYDLANQTNLRGAGIWALGYDDGHTDLWDLIGSHINVAHSPVAQVTTPQGPLTTTAVPLSWGVVAGSVPASSYRIWVSQDGGGWAQWLSGAATSATFHGFAGHGYAFYAEAFGAGGYGSGAPNVSTPATPAIQIPPNATRSEPFTGLYAVDAHGGLLAAGSPPLPPSASWPTWSIVRGLAMAPGGQGGWVLDGYGGLHPFGSAAALGATAYWGGWDIARGIAATPGGRGGYVLDGFGGLHPFGSAPALPRSDYWPNWDIARGIALNACDASGGGGWVLDGWGGLHPYGTAPAIRATSYWPHWDIARAVVSTCTGGQPGGYVLDGFGGLHPFGAAPALPNTAYWPGWDIARGLTVLPGGGGGYVVDGWGGFHPFGNAPIVDATGYSAGHDQVRGAAGS